RVFEALATGSLLLTNDLADHGLADLFADGEHLTTYADPADVPAAIERLLADEPRRERIAAAGRAEVLARHTYGHRMATLVAAARDRLGMRPGSGGTGLHSGPCLPAVEDHSLEYKSVPPGAPALLTSIVVVTFNNLAFTRACLDSVDAHTPEPHEVIVVDNGSTDGTVEYLKGRAGVRVIENGRNLGFPAAANVGIRAAVGEQVLLLNNDTIVTAGWLRRLNAAMASAPDVGLVGPVSNEVSGPQRVATDYADLGGLSCFAAERSKAFAGRTADVGRLVGFCLLVRRDVFDRVGLLDERFGVGNFEDDDLCRRATAAGFRAVIALDAFVHHHGSATFRAAGVDLAGLLDRNRALFEAKWAAEPTPAPRRPRLSLCMIVRDSARTLGACLASVKPWVDEMIVVDTGSTDDTPAIAAGFGAAVSRFPWCDDFAAARNASLERATGDWLFWMDADDTIDEANGRKLRALADRDAAPNLLGYVMQVHCPAATGDDGRGGGDPYATPTVVDHVKLVRNHPGLTFTGRIHEQLLPAIRRLGGEVAWTDAFVVHSGSDGSPAGKARKHARDLRLLDLELADHPDSTFAWFNLGMTLLDAGRPAEALAPLCRSLQLAEPGESHVRKLHAFVAQAYAALGRPATALRACERGLEAFPGDPELTFRLGVLLQQAGRLDEAERAFQSLLEPRGDRVFASVDAGIVGVKAWHNL
ncbi:MAG TPA: glycosyltransferase, partial [Humisphaera sp.]